MPQLRSSTDVDVSAFLADGLGIKQHLSRYLDLTLEQLEQRLPSSTDDLADLHPGAFRPEDATAFYEDTVGTGHLLELAAWHLSSADYIADTLRLQGMAVQGQVLDFGGGIGTHALSAAALPGVDHAALVAGMKARGHRAAREIAGADALADELAGEVAAGDMVVCLGAGDITRWAAGLAPAITARKGGAA